MAPMRKAARPHKKGMRHMGAMNMQKPVAMPMGGMTIFFRVTAVRPSRTRQRRTPHRPARETMAVSAVFDSMVRAFPVWGDGQRGGWALWVNFILIRGGVSESTACWVCDGGNNSYRAGGVASITGLPIFLIAIGQLART